MCLGTLVLGFAFAANVMADDKIKASDFVEEASAKGLAENWNFPNRAQGI